MPTLTSFCIRTQSSKLLVCCLLLAAAGAAQLPDITNRREQAEEKRLPNGKLQSEVILKADHEANLKDLAGMRGKLEAIEDELKKSQGHVLSLKAMKDLEEVEKTARRIRGRMKRF